MTGLIVLVVLSGSNGLNIIQALSTSPSNPVEAPSFAVVDATGLVSVVVESLTDHPLSLDRVPTLLQNTMQRVPDLHSWHARQFRLRPYPHLHR